MGDVGAAIITGVVGVLAVVVVMVLLRLVVIGWLGAHVKGLAAL